MNNYLTKPLFFGIITISFRYETIMKFLKEENT